jgi:hypothetical protein
VEAALPRDVHERLRPEAGGSRYTLTANVRLRWPYRLLSALVKPLVLARMRRHVVEPLVAAAEAG